MMQVDPALERSVVVSTKFDTRIPQFATGNDADAFLHPAAAQLMTAKMLGGGPFFTSVPSGRVGSAQDDVFHRYKQLQHTRVVGVMLGQRLFFWGDNVTDISGRIELATDLCYMIIQLYINIASAPVHLLFAMLCARHFSKLQ